MDATYGSQGARDTQESPRSFCRVRIFRRTKVEEHSFGDKGRLAKACPSEFMVSARIAVPLGVCTTIGAVSALANLALQPIGVKVGARFGRYGIDRWYVGS